MLYEHPKISRMIADCRFSLAEIQNWDDVHKQVTPGSTRFEPDLQSLIESTAWRILPIQPPSDVSYRRRGIGSQTLLLPADDLAGWLFTLSVVVAKSYWGHKLVGCLR